ncbi:MAG: AMP-binding enzyme, partial [Acidimicrobiia bacterium]
ALLPHVEFANLYGPTETNVCTAYRVPAPPDPAGGDIPIGKAIANDQTLVITEDGRLADRGEVGELLVRGATVMQGYWGDPEKTAPRLIPNPFGRDLVYRTGDLVVEQDDGNYRFLGRRDHQVKSRGYRIELGEIETVLNSHPRVMESAVVAIPDEMISNRLKAFVASGDQLTEGELVEFCAARLPRYMVPESFEFRDTLPKTSTGKIDRQGLAAG